MAHAITTGGCILLLLSTLHAQSVPPRLRGVSNDPAPAPTGQTSPTPAPAPAPIPAQSTPAASETAPSLLQQPAQDAKIVFDDNKLTIHADNSSLAGILHQVASSSGMKIEGLGGDERVFGTFGPGVPRDVLADLLDGTAYNVALIGDLSNGAPRELLLSPATHGAAAPATPATPTNQANEQEGEDVPQQPPQEAPQQPTVNTPATPGVRSPQQLFEQLQRMRQGAQPTPQAPVQQDSPQQ